jgi:hypothetical protein
MRRGRPRIGASFDFEPPTIHGRAQKIAFRGGFAAADVTTPRRLSGDGQNDLVVVAEVESPSLK